MTKHDHATLKTSKSEELVSYSSVKGAAERLEGIAKKTPMDFSRTFAEKSGADKVGFKMENFQRTGAFKLRGAYNKISRLSGEDKERGVIAASSGNHAQGVALAARELGVEATIVMPENTPDAKVEATSGYGADVVLHGEEFEESKKYARKLEKEQGLTFVHPYNDPGVIAGQGTLGKEMVEQFPELNTVFVAIGGGGLISGVATAVKHLNPDSRVVGVQTEGCGSAKQTINREKVYERDSVDTVAKGIATRRVGDLPAGHMRELVDEVVYVSDEQVKATVAMLAERQKVVTEPAGAVAASAVLFSRDLGMNLEGRKVAVPLCGANTDLEKFGENCTEGKEYLEETGSG
ncbi:MAG: threonine/serine dehydratase [Candidatus Nanohaloarchaea archaeon]